MAFQPANVQRGTISNCNSPTIISIKFSELANRKILEDLQLKKQLLLKQGVASTLTSTSLPVLGSPTVTLSDGFSMSSVQRTALQTANSQSTGFFITQDSSFGNYILPVLPRFDAK